MRRARIGDRVLAPVRGWVRTAPNYRADPFVLIHADDGDTYLIHFNRLHVAEPEPYGPCPDCGHTRHLHYRCPVCPLLAEDAQTR